MLFIVNKFHEKTNTDNVFICLAVVCDSIICAVQPTEVVNL